MKTFCFNTVLFCQLLHIAVSGQKLMFIRALPGETMILKYNLNVTYASWFVPAHGQTNSRFIELTDEYGLKRKWNIIKYSENADINNLTLTNRLQIVGNYRNAEFFLKITNITSEDIGLYRCDMVIFNMETVNIVTNSFILQLKYKDGIVVKSLPVLNIVILSSVITIALLVAGIGLYVRRLKQRNKERMEHAINFQTPEETFGDSAHYAEIIEANDNSIMLIINRDTDLASTENRSTSSEDNGDSSEYLDDGYEQPYTTLVVTDQVKDDHVYLSTKNESNYENAMPFQNVATGHTCEFLEEDYK